MQCAISGSTSNNLCLTTINGVQCYVLPRYADLQKHLNFIDEHYSAQSGIVPSSKVFEFAAEIRALVDTADDRFADNPKAAHIFRTMLSEDLFDDSVLLYATYTRWLEESGY